MKTTARENQPQVIKGLTPAESSELMSVFAAIKKCKTLEKHKFVHRAKENDIEVRSLSAFYQFELQALDEILKDTGIYYFITCTSRNGEMQLLIY